MPSAPRLLIVDDSDLICLTLQALFEEEGFEVEAARSVDEALSHLDPRTPFAAVILDLHIGERSGLELLPRLTKSAPAAKIILSTGSAAHELEEIEGVDAVLHKDEDFSVTLACVRALLGG